MLPPYLTKFGRNILCNNLPWFWLPSHHPWPSTGLQNRRRFQSSHRLSPPSSLPHSAECRPTMKWNFHFHTVNVERCAYVAVGDVSGALGDRWTRCVAFSVGQFEVSGEGRYSCHQTLGRYTQTRNQIQNGILILFKFKRWHWRLRAVFGQFTSDVNQIRFKIKWFRFMIYK